MIGSTISHYQILEKLGEGGMGVVYKARDLQLERSVALKLVSKNITNSRFRTGLLREAKLAASLSHPNIAHVYEAGEAEGEWYIAMEFIDGETLRQKMKPGAATLPELIGFISQVTDALQHAHARGVVHCDLKPENIIVTGEGRAKVLDFGLARLIRASRREENPALRADQETQTMSSHWSSEFIEGTLGYMSPEQAEGEEPITASTDIFSLGCIIFEAAAHAVPFSDPSPIRALHKLLYDPAPKLREVARSAPAQLQPVLDLCLAKKPGNRANNLVEIGEQLRQFLRSASQDQKGSPQPIRDRLSSALQGRRKIWAPAALSVLLLVVAAAVRFTHAPSLSGSKAGELQISSLAVLPFTNASGAAGDNFISDGLSESLINALSRLPHLKVVARASSFRFKGEGVNTLEVARTLGVQALLTGKIRDSRNQLDVNVQLTTGKDGAVLWAHQYRSDAKDLTSTEDQIVRAVAARVRGLGNAAAETQVSESSEVVPEAYSLLLRGRYEMRLYNPQSTLKAVDYYREALAIDPGFALANAELANSYRLLSGAGILKPSEAMPLAEAAALRAIGNDGRLAQAHAVLADIRRDQWNWPAAEAEYARALDLNPNLVSAHTGFAIYLSLVQRVPEAIREATKARDLDPVGVPTSINAGAVYYNCRKYDEALRELERSTVLDPSASALWTWIGIVHGGSGHYSEAIQAYEKARRLGDRTAATRCNYGYSLAKSGRRTEAQAILKQLQSSKEFIPPTALAILYLGLGQDERALELLEQALSSRDQLVQYIGVESHFDQFHGSPRFQKLTAKLGLPVAAK